MSRRFLLGCQLARVCGLPAFIIKKSHVFLVRFLPVNIIDYSLLKIIFRFIFQISTKMHSNFKMCCSFTILSVISDSLYIVSCPKLL